MLTIKIFNDIDGLGAFLFFAGIAASLHNHPMGPKADRRREQVRYNEQIK